MQKEHCNQEIYREVADRVNVSEKEVEKIIKFISATARKRIEIGRFDTIRFIGLGSFKPNVKKIIFSQEKMGVYNQEPRVRKHTREFKYKSNPKKSTK